jgi:hypothetical protein
VILDCNTFIGAFPFRHLPHPDPEVLVRVLAREGVDRAWVGHLPSAFHRDPGPGNAELYSGLAAHRELLIPAPTLRPDWPDWESSLEEALDKGARAIRTYPQHYGFGPGDERLTRLAAACASRKLSLVLTTRFEDLRQRHSLDTAPDLGAASIRELARAGTGARIVVTAAGRDLIEEVHWGLTPAERELVFFDISWIWGPPSDDLSHLLRTVGHGRFVYGSMWPLRLAQLPRANLALRESDTLALHLANPAGW